VGESQIGGNAVSASPVAPSRPCNWSLPPHFSINELEWAINWPLPSGGVRQGPHRPPIDRRHRPGDGVHRAPTANRRWPPAGRRGPPRNDPRSREATGRATGSSAHRPPIEGGRRCRHPPIGTGGRRTRGGGNEGKMTAMTAQINRDDLLSNTRISTAMHSANQLDQLSVD